MTRESKPEPRSPDAGVFSQDRLSSDQKNAFHRVQELLGGSYEDGATHQKNAEDGLRFLPRIDERRTIQVIGIDGGRGSGKTAVMLTLLHEWSKKIRTPDPTKPMIVPLQILDLHPVHQNSNLLMLLVSRLHEVVDALFGPNTSPPWLAEEKEKRNSSTSWKQLAYAVAAWSGQLKARQSQLDPESFALELEEESRRSISIDIAFRDFFDDLVRDFQAKHSAKWGKCDPLFVIPIDDADMSPYHSPRMLELVRTLYHPRLFFLMTGDSNFFIDTLKSRFMKPIAELGPRARTIADGLAHDFYFRVLPTSHRVRLNPLTAEARLSLLIGHDSNPRSMRALLKEVPISRGQTLYDLVELDLGEPAREPRLAALFPDRIRRLGDLVKDVAHLLPEQKDETAWQDLAAKVASKLWCRIVEQGVESKISKVLVPTPSEDVLKGALFPRGTTIAVEAKRVREVTIEVRPLDGPSGSAPRERIVIYGLHELNIDVTPTDEEDAWVKVDPSINAGVRLLWDLNVRMFPNSSKLERLVPNPQDAPLVVVTTFLPNRTLRVPWLQPRWNEFQDYERFALRWTKIAQELSRTILVGAERAITPRLAKAFLLLAAEIARGPKVDVIAFSEKSWSEVVEEVFRARTQLASDFGSLRQELWNRWLFTETQLFAAPGSGLSAEEAETALSAIRSKLVSVGPIGRSLLSAWRDQLRADETKAFDRAAATELIAELRKSHSKNGAWAGFWSAIGRPIEEGALEVLEQALGDARFVEDSQELFLRGSKLNYLRDLLKTPEREELLAKLTPSEAMSIAGRLADAAQVLGNNIELLQVAGYRESEDWLAQYSHLRFRVFGQPAKTDVVGTSASFKMQRVRLYAQTPVASDSEDVFLRLLSDIVVESSKRPRFELEEGPRWYGLELQHRTGQTVYWPNPAFQSAYDFELFNQHWNKIAQQQNKIGKIGELYIESAVEVALRQRVPQENAPRKLSECLRELYETRSSEKVMQGARWHGFRDLRRRVLLFTLPELGVADRIGKQIVDTIEKFGAPPELLESASVHLESERAQLNQNSAFKNTEPLPPNHPWVRLRALMPAIKL